MTDTFSNSLAAKAVEGLAGSVSLAVQCYGFNQCFSQAVEVKRKRCVYFVHPQEMPKDVTINRDMLNWILENTVLVSCVQSSVT